MITKGLPDEIITSTTILEFYTHDSNSTVLMKLNQLKIIKSEMNYVDFIWKS